MSRLSFLLCATTMGLVLCDARQAAEAGPVTLGLEAYEELANALPAKESSSAAEPEKHPTKVDVRPRAQKAMVPTGSTSGSSPSTVTQGASPPSALISPEVSYQPTLWATSLAETNQLFVPPRFLDGVFRPPEFARFSGRRVTLAGPFRSSNTGVIERTKS